MDEQLPTILELWDPQTAQATRERLPEVSRKSINKEAYLQDLAGVYHAIGGHARFAHTAHGDPKWFYKNFLKRLLPDERSEVDFNVNIYPAVPKSSLDVPFEEIKDAEFKQPPPPGDLDALPGPE